MVARKSASIADIDKAVRKVSNYLDAKKDFGWQERRQTWVNGWMLMQDLLVSPDISLQCLLMSKVPG